MIPRHIHQIWVHPTAPIPKHLVPFQESVLTINPQFNYTLWTNDSIEQELFNGPIPWKEFRTIVELTNYLRLKLLNQFGGVYVDLDCSARKPLIEFYEKTKDSSIILGIFTRIPSRNQRRISDLTVCMSEVNSLTSFFEAYEVGSISKSFNAMDATDWLIDNMDYRGRVVASRFFYSQQANDASIFVHKRLDF